MFLPQEWPKLNPQTEFGLSLCITALPTTVGRGGYIFVVRFFVFYILYKYFIALLQFLFNSSSMVIPWERPKISPQTKFCLLSRNTALPASMGRGGYIFVVSLFSPLHFFKFFIAMSHNVFHLNTYRPNVGMAKTQPTEGVWPPALHHTLPTSMGSSVFILKVRFNFLCHFCSCLFY